MKNKLYVLLILVILNSPRSAAQEIEKMNKSELRDFISLLNVKIDSLKSENIKYEEYFKKLSANLSQLELNSSQLETKIKMNETEILRLSKLLSDSESEKKRIIAQNQIEVIRLNKKISTLQDSILGIQTFPNSEVDVSLNTNDFLNEYYFNQIPLPNNSYSLVLSKLVYGSKLNYERYNYNYNNDENKGAVIRLPEILNANTFTYWSVKPNSMISPFDFNKLVVPRNSDFFNSKLPKIEILKNKLFTLKYNDGKEESFLFNVKKYISEHGDNQRKVLQIELANEQVKDDGENDTSRDIVWRFFALDNECYLALSSEQLNRLNMQLNLVNEGVEVFNDTSKRESSFASSAYYNDSRITTGNGIYLSRNKDIFMDASRYVDPSEVIFLFKLK